MHQYVVLCVSVRASLVLLVKVQAELVSARVAWEQQREELTQRHEDSLSALKERLEQQHTAVRAATLSTEQWKAK